METTVLEQRLDTLHRDLNEMQRTSKENQESLKREVRGISDKISNFSEKFARLDGLDYSKQIEKLERSEEGMAKKIESLQSYQNKIAGAVAVLYVIATALVGAVFKWLLGN